MRSGSTRSITIFLLAIVPSILSLGSSQPALGAETTGDSNARIEALEAENAEIREELAAQQERLEALGREESDDASSEPQESDLPSVDSEDGLFAIKGKFPMSLSGFLKGDMLWNDARLNSTSAPRFVLPEVPGYPSDDQFTATVQHSRIIGKLGDVALGDDVKLRALVELDFFNLADTGDTNFNNNQLRLRQLYMELDISSWSILIGQSWDLFSPLNVATLNTNGNYWFGGNAGFRRPQLRVSKTFTPTEGHRISLAASANANTGVTVTDGGRVLNSGRDSGIPVVEGRLEYSMPAWAGPIALGASGVWGQEDVDGVRSGIDQWAVGAHVTVPLMERLALKGEFQHGSNTDAFLFGGGIDVATGNAVESNSAWAQLVASATDKLSVTAMGGFDNPYDSDVVGNGRTFNWLVGASVKYQLFKPLTFGVEYTHFDTKYKGLSDQVANMVWFSGILKF